MDHVDVYFLAACVISDISLHLVIVSLRYLLLCISRDGFANRRFQVLISVQSEACVIEAKEV